MSKEWYPIVNEETCAECGVCISKCPHGVYDKGSPHKPSVIFQEGCIDRCHGCEALCPTGSISYAGNMQEQTQAAGMSADGCSCGGCSCGGTSESKSSASKTLTVDFLYLDLNTCERCMATDSTLQEALAALSGVLDTLGYSVAFNKINITTEALAEQYHFLSSPTIRANGIDICNSVTESDCSSCGAICGSDVDCRTFQYEGETYDQPPKAMLIDGILRVIYGQPTQEQSAYVLPDNLERFFAGLEQTNIIQSKKEVNFMKTMQIFEPAMCCDTGLCGVSVDPELLRISTVLGTLKKNGIEVKRYNLTSAPQEFVKNTEISALMMNEGVEILPVTVLDGKIVKTGKYPTNDELATMLGIPASTLAQQRPQGGCGCGSKGCC